MSTPFLGQLLLASWNYAPKHYAQCNGQLMTIKDNQALYALLGTMYGGDGVSVFALPDLQGRTPIAFSQGFIQGGKGGEERHALIVDEVPPHSHALQGTTSPAGMTNPSGALLGSTSGNATLYTAAANLVGMSAGTVALTGGGQPHENRQPFLVMNWCIALNGIFPTPSLQSAESGESKHG